MNNTKIFALKKEIENLNKTLTNKKLSISDKQIILDSIDEKRREIEKLCKQEKQIVTVSGAPKIKDKKRSTKVSSFVSDGSIRF